MIVDPRPEQILCPDGTPAPKGYDETSIDLHLGPLDVAKVWDLDAMRAHDRKRGLPPEFGPPELWLGSFDWKEMADGYLKDVPDARTDDDKRRLLVYRRNDEVVVRPSGFLLWSTLEKVGTPNVDLAVKEPQRHPELICFVNAKSTKARTGLIVHFTAPTIHAGWAGNITLEISNLGPFTFVLKAGDALAQLTVATISSAPDLALKKGKSKTQGQRDPSGAARGVNA